MSLLVFITIDFVLIGVVSLVGLFALERAMISETWRRWPYMMTGIVAAVLAVFLILGLLDNWDYELHTYVASVSVIALWLFLRRMSDHAAYRNDPALDALPVEPMRTVTPAFRSLRGTDRSEAESEEKPVFVSRQSQR